jgi:plasmid replication initiation protein
MQIVKAIKTPLKRPRVEGRQISMSNAMALAGHGLTLTEKRIMMLAITKIKHTQKWDGVSSPEVHLTAKEYAETFNVDMQTAYDQLKDSAIKLKTRIIKFHGTCERGNRTTTHMSWVGHITYEPVNTWVKLGFYYKIVPHLLDLGVVYTKYSLEQTTALRSQYSWRLYELLMKFQKTGKANFPIEQFCNAMELTDKQRSDFNYVRRRVIEPAIRELTQKNNLVINLEIEKSGVKVKMLKFTFSQNPQRTIFEDAS